MSYYLSGALSSEASASVVQVLTGAANGSSNYRQYDWQGLSISPNGEYIIQGTLYGTGGYDSSNETTSFDPELVIWKSSSVGGFSPTTTIKMKGGNNLNHINTRFDGDNMAGSMWLDDQTIAHAVISHDPQGATYAAAPNTKATNGVFMIITGSDANWSVTTHITGVYGNPQYASQVYAPGSSQRSQPQMMFADAGPFFVEPNHKHTDATSTRIACFTSNQMADGSLSAYAAQRITIFSGSGGSWSFHSQFDVVGAANSPTENLQDHADNDFPAPQGGEYYVQDVTWIEEDIIAVVFHRKSNGGNKSYLYILKFDSSNGEWHVMDPDGSASTTADSGYKKASMTNTDAQMAHASNGIRFVEWDPYGKRLITIKDTELLIYNSGSGWIDSFNNSSTDFSDATETFDLHDKTVSRHGPFESPNGIRWRFRSGSTDIISLNTDDGESSANIQTKNTIAWASSGSSGWANNLNTTEGTFGAFTSTQIATGSFNIEIGNGGDSGNTYDAANVLVASRLSAYGTPQCEFLAWNTLAGGDGNTFIYREGSDTEHFKDSGRVVVLNLNAYPGEGDTTAPTISSVAITSATNSQNNTLNEGDVVSVTVTFDEAVTVNTSGGTPAIAISVGGVSRSATYSSGTGSTSIVFTYTIASSETADTDGISIGANAISLNSGTMQDAAGNNATITHSAVSANSSFKVDTDKPTISSLSVAANNSTVTVTFSEDVYTNSNGTGDLAAADFTLGLSGGNAESIDLDATPSEVSKTSQSIYVLTLNGTNLGSNAAGTETLSVDAASNTAIYDLAGNAHTAAASTVSLNDTATLADAVTETVGTSGGTVSAGGTNAAPGASVSIPNGALSGNTSIKVDIASEESNISLNGVRAAIADAGAVAYSPVIEITPHGTTLDSAATITFRLTGAVAGTSPANTEILKSNGDHPNVWYRLRSNLWSITDGVVTINTTSFSRFQAIGGSNMATTQIKNSQVKKFTAANMVIGGAIDITGSADTNSSLAATDKFLVQSTSGIPKQVSASVMQDFFSSVDIAETSTAATFQLVFVDDDTAGGGDGLLRVDGAGLTFNPSTNLLTAGGDLNLGGHLVADADEAKNIFAAVTTDSNAITIGGGGKVVVGGDLQLAAGGKIDDAGGHARFTATDAGATILGAADGTAGLTLAANNSSVTIAGDLVVSGNDLSFGNGATIANGDANTLTITEATLAVSADLSLGGHLVADANEAKNIFAAVTSNAITIGGGGDVVLGGDLKMAAAGRIEDAGGHARFTATDAGATVLGAADGTAGLTLAANNSDVTVAGDLVVSGGRITLTNGSIIDSETSNELQLTEDLVVVTGDLKVEGNGIQDAEGDERISLADAMVLKDADGTAVVTLHATDLSTTFAGGVTVTGDLTVQGTTTTVDSTTIMISQSFTFEGPADDHETTLHAGTPIADSTVNLPALAAGTYHLPVLADAASAASAAVTAAEFALLDGGSSVGSTALASGDGFLHNDAGTMKHTSIDKLADFFAGGAGLSSSSGVMSVNIDGLSALGGTGLHQTQDHFMFSDNGTEKKITFSNLQDAVFADVSGDATIAAGGALTIAAGAVEHGMLAEDIISGQDELAHADIVDADELMISDAGTIKRVGVDSLRDHFFGVVSGDATVADGGALTIANDAVQAAMINDDVKGNGIQVSNGVFSVSYVEDIAMSASKNSILSDDLVTASLSQEPLQGSVSVYLNGLLQMVSGSTHSEYDYEYTGGASARKVIFRTGLDADDLIQIRYIKK